MDFNQRPQRKKMIPIRLQDPMENTAKSKKPEPVVTKKKIDQKYMSVSEGKIFQCSICKVKFNSKISLESHCAKEHDRPKIAKLNKDTKIELNLVPSSLFEPNDNNPER